MHLIAWGLGGFPKIIGTIYVGPYNEDPFIWGSILGSPYLGKLPLVVLGFRIWALALRDAWTFGTGLPGFRFLG